MRPGAGLGEPGAMPDPRRECRLEIDPTSEPVSGRLTAGETSHEFVGWIGLAAALERMLAGPAEHPSPSQEERTC
jgi:hypothetical protein